MDENKKEFDEQLDTDLPEEKPSFEPSPRRKRIVAWILCAIVVLGVINWLITIAYPQWPEFIRGLLS